MPTPQNWLDMKTISGQFSKEQAGPWMNSYPSYPSYIKSSRWYLLKHHIKVFCPHPLSAGGSSYSHIMCIIGRHRNRKDLASKVRAKQLGYMVHVPTTSLGVKQIQDLLRLSNLHSNKNRPPAQEEIRYPKVMIEINNMPIANYSASLSYNSPHTAIYLPPHNWVALRMIPLGIVQEPYLAYISKLQILSRQNRNLTTCLVIKATLFTIRDRISSPPSLTSWQSTSQARRCIPRPLSRSLIENTERVTPPFADKSSAPKC